MLIEFGFTFFWIYIFLENIFSIVHTWESKPQWRGKKQEIWFEKKQEIHFKRSQTWESVWVFNLCKLFFIFLGWSQQKNVKQWLLILMENS